MLGIMLGFSLLACQAATAVPSLLLASTVEDKVIFEAMGLYKPDGEAFGAIRYRLDSDTTNRFLYQSKKGQWTITGNEANIAASKGTIVSTVSASTPVGASFRYYFDKKWKEDKSLTVSEFDGESTGAESVDDDASDINELPIAPEAPPVASVTPTTVDEAVETHQTSIEVEVSSTASADTLVAAVSEEIKSKTMSPNGVEDAKPVTMRTEAQINRIEATASSQATVTESEFQSKAATPPELSGVVEIEETLLSATQIHGDDQADTAIFEATVDVVKPLIAAEEPPETQIDAAPMNSAITHSSGAEVEFEVIGGPPLVETESVAASSGDLGALAAPAAATLAASDGSGADVAAEAEEVNKLTVDEQHISTTHAVRTLKSGAGNDEENNDDIKDSDKKEKEQCQEAMENDFESMTEEEMMVCVNVLNPQFGILLETEATTLSTETDGVYTVQEWQLVLAAGLIMLFAVTIVVLMVKKPQFSNTSSSREKSAPQNVLLEKDIGAALKQSLLKPHLEKNTALVENLAVIQTELDKVTTMLNTHSDEKAEAEISLQAALAEVAEGKSVKTAALYESEKKHQTVIMQLSKTKTANEKLEQKLNEAKVFEASAAKNQQDAENSTKETERLSRELEAKEKEVASSLSQLNTLQEELKQTRGELDSKLAVDTSAVVKLEGDLREAKSSAKKQESAVEQLQREVAETKASWAAGLKEQLSTQSKRNMEVLSKKASELKSKDAELAAALAQVETLEGDLQTLEQEHAASSAADASAESELEVKVKEAKLTIQMQAEEAQAEAKVYMQQKHAVAKALEARDAQVLRLETEVAELKSGAKRSSEQVSASTALAATDKETIDAIEASLSETKTAWATQLKEQSKRNAEVLAATKKEHSSSLKAFQELQDEEIKTTLAAARKAHDKQMQALRESQTLKEDELKCKIEQHRKDASEAVAVSAANKDALIEAQGVVERLKFQVSTSSSNDASSSERAEEKAQELTAAKTALTEAQGMVEDLKSQVSSLSSNDSYLCARAEEMAQELMQSKDVGKSLEGSVNELYSELAEVKSEATVLKAARDKGLAELNTLETKLLVLNASGSDSQAMKQSLEIAQEENSALKEMINGLEALNEENVELKQTLQQRALDEEEAKQATENLHEEMMLGLQKTMGTLAEELEETMGKVTEVKAERDDALASLDDKQDELDEIRAHASAHASELEENEVASEKISSLEAQVSALNALVDMKAASGGGGGDSSAGDEASEKAIAAALAYAESAGGDDQESADGEGEGELTMDLNSFLTDAGGEDPDDW